MNEANVQTERSNAVGTECDWPFLDVSFGRVGIFDPNIRCYCILHNSL